ncbi:MAG: CAP domain-containing protein [Flavobacteriaceae bacterium]|nr:CAP domain-containing protein [Flavobacteriaceae bacterium]
MRLNTLLSILFSLIFITCSKELDEDESVESLTLRETIAVKILSKTNAIRNAQGLSDLIQDDEMDVLATVHSKNMVEHDFFDHIDHEGKSPSNRADDLDYGFSRLAENVGYVPWFENVSGCGDTRSAEAIAECVVDGWKNSPGHYTNMIGDYIELGVGVFFTQDSIAYFTQVFRTR